MLKRDEDRGEDCSVTRPQRQSRAALRLIAALALGLRVVVSPAAAQDGASPEVPQSCVKSEFESAVDEAAAKLRDLNNTHRPAFQAKLRQLKEKRGWNDDQFMKEAAPFVKDQEISVYDDKTNELLASISTIGQEGANASEPNCKMLSDLRGLMGVLVETQGSKWSYMFQKLDGELAK